MNQPDDFKSWRKREADTKPDKADFSRQLRKAHDLIQKRGFAQALGVLDRESKGQITPAKKSKILGLAGDSLAKRGKILAAIQAYKRAEIYAKDHPRAWLRPLIAQVKLQLIQGKFDEAFENARLGIARSLKEERTFKRLRKELEKQLAETGEVVIVSRPPRPSVVATRFGHLFLRAGELDAAHFFFEKVIQVNPRGGCRARLGLAEISLRSQEYKKAQFWAGDGIVNGKFQAKTLSGWPVLIAARRGLGEPGLPLPLLRWLRGHWTTPVGQRALQHCVEELRKSEDPLWRKLAQRWLKAEPESEIIKCHLRKLLLSDAKISSDNPSEILSASLALWETNKLSLREQISAVRAIASARLSMGDTVGENYFFSAIESTYGIRGRDRAKQAVAAVLYDFGQKERAIEILTTVAKAAPLGSKRWGQANWRLAQWKYEAGSPGDAGELLIAIAEQDKTPERIRNFALVDALRMAGVANRKDITLRAKPYLETALAMISDPELLMDMSRQLGSAPDCRKLYGAFREKGERGIKEAIRAANDPAQASTLLFKYARRQNDWGDFAGTTAVWESMDQQRRAWIWSAREPYWEYLAYVMRAYTWQNLPEKAEKIAVHSVNDPATTSDGLAILGNSYAALLIYQGKIQEGIDVFRRVASDAPQHAYAAYAYYWFALEAIYHRDFHEAKIHAVKISKCLDARSNLNWIRELRCQAQLLAHAAAEKSLSDFEIEIHGYKSTEVSKAAGSILRDIAKL